MAKITAFDTRVFRFISGRFGFQGGRKLVGVGAFARQREKKKLGVKVGTKDFGEFKKGLVWPFTSWSKVGIRREGDARNRRLERLSWRRSKVLGMARITSELFCEVEVASDSVRLRAIGASVGDLVRQEFVELWEAEANTLGDS